MLARVIAVSWVLLATHSLLAGSEISEVVRKLNDQSLLFYLSFNEKDLDAEIASGHGSPVKTNGRTPGFRNGVHGPALYLASGRITYKRHANMPLAHEAGTVCFWFMPVKWDLASENQPNNTLFRAAPPTAGITRQGFKMREGRVTCFAAWHFYIYRSLNDREENAGLAIHGQPLENGKWVFVALRWSRNKVILSFNAAAPGNSRGFCQTREFTPPMTADEGNDTTKGEGRFSFSADEPGMFDEILIFNRMLTQQELSFIYNAGLAEQTTTSTDQGVQENAQGSKRAAAE